MPKGVYTKSENQKRRISETLKLKGIKPKQVPWTEERRKKLSKYFTGRKPWNKGRILGKNPKHSEKMKGIKWSVEVLEKRKKALKEKLLGKPRTREVKEKISVAHKGTKKPWSSISNSKRVGEKNPNWQGGKTPEYSARFNKLVWKNIRKLVLQRDNNTCQKCKKMRNNLDVHHKKPWRFSKNDDSDNLISLCRKCHREEDAKLQAIKEKNQEKLDI